MEGRKELFLTTGQPWSEAWQSVLELHPDYFDAYVKMALVPIKNRHLSAKFQSLVLLACDASVTHLYTPGIKVHIENSFRLGATKEEVMEVLELTSVLGIHAITVGVTLLYEVLDEQPERAQPKVSDEEMARLSAGFKNVRGYDPRENWKTTMNSAPDFFEAYTEFSGVPFGVSSRLSPMEKELIYVSIDAGTTHLFQPGLKLHIRNAINYGATSAQIVECLQLAALMGVQTVLEAAPFVQACLPK